jgi:site-specific DNA recombinase
MPEILAAVYARVSSDQQAEAHTIGSQIAALRARVAEDGLEVPPEREFLDDGFSGATLVRPALERLRDLAAEGAIDRVYVHSPDRLARKYAYQALLLDEFQAVGVQVVFLNRALGQSPEDELLLQVQGMMAEYERAKILERSRRGKRHGAHLGNVAVLSGAPFGYRYIRKDEGGGAARYEIVLDEARVVRQVFHWVGLERASIGEVCRRLNAAGERTRTGHVWERSVVWAMLKNPAYQGQAAFGKTQAGPLGPRLRAQRGRALQPRRPVATRDVPPEHWLAIPVPALVDAALFATVAEQLETNRRHARQNQRGARYLLQGLVICGQCGYAYYGKAISLCSRRGRPRDYAYYRCLGADAYRFGGVRICPNTQVRTDRLDTATWHEVRQLLNEPYRLEQEYRQRLVPPKEQTADATAVDKQRHKLRQGLARLIDGYAEGFVEKDEFEPRVARLRQRLAALDEQARQLADAAASQRELRLMIGRLEDFAARVSTGLEAADWSTRREIIRTLVSRVEIDHTQVNVVFRVPPNPFVSSPSHDVLQHCGRGDLTSASEHLFALCVGRVVRAGHQATAEGPGDPDPLRGRRGAGLQRRRRCASGAGRAAEASWQVRPEPAPREDQMDRLSPTATRGRPEWANGSAAAGDV